jgi:hypothetical protein
MSAFTNEGTENLMRWDRRAQGFMEVWFVTLNHADSGSGVWIRYTITSPASGRGSPFCELWGFVFDSDGKRSLGAKNRFDIDRLGTSYGRDDGAIVRVGDAFLAENHLEGMVEREGRTLAWSLDFDPADRCYQHLPVQLRNRAAKRVSTLCSPNLAVPFSGTVTVDDDDLTFTGELGCQTHRWGRRHSRSWAWAHCSAFDGNVDATFEGLVARTSLGPLSLPSVTPLYLEYEGEDIVLNDLRSAIGARSHDEMPTWAFTANNRDYKVTGAARADVGRLMQVTYDDPDGSLRHCANSEIADLGLEIYRRHNRRWRHIRSLSALRTAHVEFGRPEPFEELPVLL